MSVRRYDPPDCPIFGLFPVGFNCWVKARRLAICFCAVAAGLQAGPELSFETRLANLEAVMQRYYRGDSLESLVKQINDETEAMAAKAEVQRAAIEAATQLVKRNIGAANELRKQLDELEKKTSQTPDSRDRDAVKKYNDLVKEHNALVERCDKAFALARVQVEAQGELARQYEAKAASAASATAASRDRFRARENAFSSFTASGEDERFFSSLNRLLADLCAEERAGRPQRAALAKVRAMRRELAAWAIARQGAQAHPLILVEATVGGEPCCLILDTGAQTTTLSPELVDAIGLARSLGEETELRVAGGGKARGRSFELPSLMVAGAEERNVGAACMKISGVGVDGLLGQSFLSRFDYSIDENQKGKVVLRRH